MLKVIKFNRIVNIATVILSILLASAGCTNNSQGDRISKNIDIKVIVKETVQQQKIVWQTATTSSGPEYNYKSCELVIEVDEDQQVVLMEKLINAFKNSIIKCGGAITGGGNAGVTNRNELLFQTKYSSGVILIYCSQLEMTQIKVITVLFETPKKNM